LKRNPAPGTVLLHKKRGCSGGKRKSVGVWKEGKKPACGKNKQESKGKGRRRDDRFSGHLVIWFIGVETADGRPKRGFGRLRKRGKKLFGKGPDLGS